MKLNLLFLVIFLQITAHAQVLISSNSNDEDPNPASILELRASDKGLLLPRLSKEPENPVAGLLYYSLTEKCFKAYNGTEWVAMGTACEKQVTLHFEKNQNTFNETDEIGSIFINYDNPGSSPIPVNVITTPSSTSPIQLNTATNPIQIPAGKGSFEYVFEWQNNTTYNGDATFTLSFEESGAYVVTPEKTTVITIQDDEQAPTSTNLVTNGSFKSKKLSGWDTVNDAKINTSEGQDDSYSIEVKNNGGSSQLNQKIAIEAGATYTISYWYKVKQKSKSNNTRIWSSWYNDNSPINNDAATLRPNTFFNDASEWTNFTTTITAPADATHFLFEVRTYKKSTVLYDNFSMIKQ